MMRTEADIEEPRSEIAHRASAAVAQKTTHGCGLD